MHFRFAISLLLLTGLAAAQTSDLRLPITLAADSTDYDGKSSMMMVQGLRLSQGTTNIEADEGRATKIDFEDSVWHFDGNVVIDVEAGHIESDSAELHFEDTRLTLAIIVGKPATFERKARIFEMVKITVIPEAAEDQLPSEDDLP